MNPFIVMEKIEHAIKIRKFSEKSTYCIIARAGEILCVPLKSTQHDDAEFARYTDGYLAKGFTSTDWNHLADIIADYLDHRKEDDANAQKPGDLIT